jgi:hypothetical protein
MCLSVCVCTAPLPHFLTAHIFRRYNEFLPAEDQSKVEMAEDGKGPTLYRAIEAWLERAPFVNVGEWSFLIESEHIPWCLQVNSQ